MAISTAREQGFPVDEAAAKAAVKQTADYMDARRERILQGIVPPGGIDTTSYILFGLAVEKFPGDEATEASVRYLKFHQSEDGHWQIAVSRPPLESSSIEATAVCLRDLQAFAPAAQRDAYAASVAKAAAWLATAEPRINEDYALKILGLIWAHGSQAAIAQTAAALAKRQQDDGGWRQLPDLESDAYATGQALVALRQAGMKTSDPVYQRGVAFLVRTQAEDGSWHVKTRTEPFQLYFESGFPYGKDQFISAAGTSWAATALALAQPVPAKRAAR